MTGSGFPRRDIATVPDMPSKTDPDYDEKKRERTKVMHKNSLNRRKDQRREDYLQAKVEANGDPVKVRDWLNKRNKETREKREKREQQRGRENPSCERTAADAQRAVKQENARVDEVDALSQSFKSISVNQEDAGKERQG